MKTCINGNWVGKAETTAVLNPFEQPVIDTLLRGTASDVELAIISAARGAIAMANDRRFGLSAGIFTQNIDWAMRFAQEVESGTLHINSSPQWRAYLNRH